MNGQITKILSNDYFVSTKNEQYICKSRGKFRNENITPKVGDYVFFDKENKYILEVLERKNSLDRPNVSNIDQAFILTSLKHPNFSSNLLDKLLTICLINKINPIICVSKKDLVDKKDFKKIKQVLIYYKKLGFVVIYNNELRKIKKLLTNKTTVFTGQSGSGKSTLMNNLDKNLNLETDEISIALGRGKHTTRCVTLIEMYGGKVLDTPGFSDIDLSIYPKEQIRDSFVEFKKHPCPFKNCMHNNEHDCTVKINVKNEKILRSRYDNYLKFINY